jgi:hypothetical protein
MWVVFYDPNTAFNHPDKYIVAIVSDDDIFAYQTAMPGEKHEISADNPYLQPFVTQHPFKVYYARRFDVWTADTPLPHVVAPPPRRVKHYLDANKTNTPPQ